MRARYIERREVVLARVKSAYMANPERVKARVRSWKVENRDRVRASSRKCYQENRDEMRERSRLLRSKNRDKELQRSRAFRETHRKRLNAEARQRVAELKQADPSFVLRERARQRDYYSRNKDKGAVKNSKRRAKILKAEGHYSANDVARLRNAQKHRCAVCKSKRKLTVDHIIPLTAGGSNWPSNLQMLCLPCNSAKRDRDPIAFMQSRGALL
jgi:5-methylcytosine-specific restriction endonuclease McrA